MDRATEGRYGGAIATINEVNERWHGLDGIKIRTTFDIGDYNRIGTHK